VDAIGALLAGIGDSKVFRVVTHLIQILPAVLPGLVMLVRDKPVPNLDALNEAATKSLDAHPAVSGAAPKHKMPEFPDLLDSTKKKLEESRDTLTDAVTRARTDLKAGFDKSVESLTKIGTMLDEVKKDKSFLDALDDQETKIRGRSQTFAGALIDSEKQQLASRPETGLKKIADAYETWLTQGGLNRVLDSIGTYLQHAPSAAAFGPSSAMNQPGTRPPAVVEIKEVIIDLGAPVSEPRPSQGDAAPSQSFDWATEHVGPEDAFEIENRYGRGHMVPGTRFFWNLGVPHG
jgi:hypothetical protein